MGHFMDAIIYPAVIGFRLFRLGVTVATEEEDTNQRIADWIERHPQMAVRLEKVNSEERMRVAALLMDTISVIEADNAAKQALTQQRISDRKVRKAQQALNGLRGTTGEDAGEKALTVLNNNLPDARERVNRPTDRI